MANQNSPATDGVAGQTKGLQPQAEAARAAGWQVFPLPCGEKWPPPKGYTGRNGSSESLTVLDGANWGLRMPRGVCAIDVDHGYPEKSTGRVKAGLVTLMTLQTELGLLPATWTLTSRDLGSEGRVESGQRFYCIPPDVELCGEVPRIGDAVSDIEIVQHHHRYAVGSGSMVEGRTYVLRDPDGNVVDAMPAAAELPELPQRWIEALRAGRRARIVVGPRGEGVEVPTEPRQFTARGAEQAYRNAVMQYRSAEVPGFNRAAFSFLVTSLAYARARGVDDDDWAVDAEAELLGHPYFEDGIWTDLDDDDLRRIQEVIDRSQTVWIVSEEVDAVGAVDVAAGVNPKAPKSWLLPGYPSDDWGRTAEAVLGHAYTHRATGRRLLMFWSERWLRWDGSAWTTRKDSVLADELRLLLESAKYMVFPKPTKANPHPKPIEASVNPTQAMITELMHAMRARLRLDEQTSPGTWLDGRPLRSTVPMRRTYVSRRPGWVSDWGSEWFPADADPALFNLSALTVPFDPTAEVPRQWLESLDYVFDGDADGIAALQEFGGYVLSGRTDLQVGLQFLGPPGSFKSEFVRVLGSLYGLSFEATGIASLATNFGLDKAMTSPVLYLSDARGDRGDRGVATPALAVQRLLAITGEDPTRVDQKFKDGVSVKLPCRVIVAANGPLELPDTSGAFDRRWVFVRTSRSFGEAQDPDKAKVLHTVEGLQGIANWFIEGLERLDSRPGGGTRKFTRQAAALQDREDSIRLGSPLHQFIADHCVVGAEYSVPLDGFYASYCDALPKGIKHPFKSQLRVDLKAAGYNVGRPKVRSGNGRINGSEIVRGLRFDV